MGPCKDCGSRIGEGIYYLTCERQLGNCAPAQEEKEMESNEMRCRQCDTVYRGDECPACALRERWDRAFYAALTGLMSCAHEVDCGVDGLVHDAGLAADSTIRRHADMMAARDVVIAEVVG